MSSTDCLQLSENKIFKHLRETLKETKKARSLIAIRSDILYAWDSNDNCVLALNIKTSRSLTSDEVQYQSLLPLSPPWFTPDRLVVNESNTLLAAYGPNGVLIFELPILTPPYGTFCNNKPINYVRSHSLHEQTLAFSTKIEVRQVRFHPGSSQDHHVCMLTNDNIFRVFAIENGKAIGQGVFHVGPLITGSVPSSQLSMQEALGETAQDFDFGAPEICHQPKSLTKKDLKWPIYLLSGNGTIHIMTVDLGDKSQPILYGPHLINPIPDGKLSNEFCSMAVFQTVPTVLAIANSNGHVFHVLVLPNDPSSTTYQDNEEPRISSVYCKSPKSDLILLETLELEFGYTINSYSLEESYTCPIYLFKDDDRDGKYFATHECGVHGIQIGCISALNKFADEQNIDEPLLGIVNNSSTIEDLISTKTSEDTGNPVVGFALYYDVHSYLTLLANGQLVTRPIISTIPNDSLNEQDIETFSSPLKRMLTNKFDQQIQRILMQGGTQPILKLSSSEGKTQQDCYELIQRAAASLRERFENHEKARIEIDKRIRALLMLKDYQSKELSKMTEERTQLQNQAELLAEKYEDMNEKQEQIFKRCQRLLIMIAKHQEVPSIAEKEFHSKLKENDDKIEIISDAIDKLRKKMLYQESQIRNHRNQVQKNMALSNEQSESFKSSLHDMTCKISQMMKEVNEYKNQINIC